jgi:hypothetical protein
MDYGWTWLWKTNFMQQILKPNIVMAFGNAMYCNYVEDNATNYCFLLP